MSKLKDFLFLIWCFKWLWVGILPLPIVYFGFHKQYFFLGHDNDWQILVEYASLELIPALTILGSMWLFKIGIDKGIAVVSSMMINSWYLYKTVPVWSVHFFKLLTKKGINLISLYEKWSLIMQMNGFWGYLISDVIQLILIISAFWCLVRNRALMKFDVSFSSGKPKSHNFGTARFLGKKRLKKITDDYGIVIGAIPKNTDFTDPLKMANDIKKQTGGELIKIKADHAILIAPSGAGKNVGVIMPTLLDYPGPVCVTDIKGENYEVTKRARETMGQKVIAFDPFEITSSPKISINLLSFLDPNDKNVIDHAQTLADLICPTSQNEGTAEAYFQKRAASFIKCFILYVIAKKPIEEKNLYTVYQTICKEEKELVQLIKEISEDHDILYGELSNLANSFLGSNIEGRSDVFETAKNHLKFLGSPYIRDALSHSDFELSEIVRGHTDLFICIPPEKVEDQKILLRLFIGIVFIEMLRAKGDIGKHKLLMVIDEMPVLGYLRQIDNIRSYGRGFGMSLLAVSQTIPDLQNAYPNTWKAFFSSQLSIFFGAAELDTSKFISEKLGTHTIEVNSMSQSEGIQKRNRGADGASIQSGSSTSETGRELLKSNEVELLGDRVALAFKRGEYPIICHRIDYRERKEWKGLWDENTLYK